MLKKRCCAAILVLAAVSGQLPAELHLVAMSEQAIPGIDDGSVFSWYAPNARQDPMNGISAFYGDHRLYFYARRDYGVDIQVPSLFTWDATNGTTEFMRGRYPADPALLVQMVICNSGGAVAYVADSAGYGHSTWIRHADGRHEFVGRDVRPIELTDSGHLLITAGTDNALHLVHPQGHWQPVEGECIVDGTETTIYLTAYPGGRYLSNNLTMAAQGYIDPGGSSYYPKEFLSLPGDYTHYAYVDTSQLPQWAWQFREMLGTGDMIFRVRTTSGEYEMNYLRVDASNSGDYVELLPPGCFVTAENVADPVLIEWLYEFADSGALAGIGKRAWTETDGIYVMLPDGRWYEVLRAEDTIAEFGTLGYDLVITDLMDDGTVTFAANEKDAYGTHGLFVWMPPSPTPEPATLLLITIGGVFLTLRRHGSRNGVGLQVASWRCVDGPVPV